MTFHQLSRYRIPNLAAGRHDNEHYHNRDGRALPWSCAEGGPEATFSGAVKLAPSCRFLRDVTKIRHQPPIATNMQPILLTSFSSLPSPAQAQQVPSPAPTPIEHSTDRAAERMDYERQYCSFKAASATSNKFETDESVCIHPCHQPPFPYDSIYRLPIGCKRILPVQCQHHSSTRRPDG